MTDIIQRVPINMNIIISQKNNLPCVELRRAVTDTELLKSIISAAFHEVPILIQPRFSDKLKSVNTLIEKGIIYIDQKDGKYYFTI